MKFEEKKLLSNTIIFFIGSFGTKIIQFFLIPLYTYCLSTDQYGTTELVLSLCNILLPVFSLSIADGMLRYGLDKTVNKNEVLKTSLFIGTAGIMLSLILIPIIKAAGVIKGWELYFFIILAFQIYRSILSINLKVNDKNMLYALDSILYTAVLCISNVILLKINQMGITGYFLSYIIANFISIVFLIIVGGVILQIKNAKYNVKLSSEMLKYSVPMIGNAISWWIISASDRFFLKYYWGESFVGIYSISDKIPTILSTISGVFLQAWVISAVNEYNNNNNSFYKDVFKKYYVGLFFGATIINTFIKSIIFLYVSKEFVDAWRYSPILISGAVYSGIFGFFSGVYAASKNSINVTITTVIGALINIVLNYILIPQYGIYGAVIATCVSWIITDICRIVDSRRYIQFDIDFGKLFVFGVLNLIQCVIVIKCEGVVSYAVSLVVVLLMIIFNWDECKSFFKFVNSIKNRVLKI